MISLHQLKLFTDNDLEYILNYFRIADYRYDPSSRTLLIYEPMNVKQAAAMKSIIKAKYKKINNIIIGERRKGKTYGKPRTFNY